MEVENMQHLNLQIPQQLMVQEAYEPTPTELIRDMIISFNFEEEIKQDEMQMFELWSLNCPVHLYHPLNKAAYWNWKQN